MNIFVAKLNFDTNENTLWEVFGKFGEVTSVKIVMDKFTHRSKGYGFVEMADEDAGTQAIEALNESEIDGRTIVVKKAEPRENRPRRNFNRDGGGYGNRY